MPGHIRQIEGDRVLIALIGAPASGKSHLAAELAATLGSAAVVPMDGFHRENDWLDAEGLRARKGAPETFDVEGLLTAVRTLRTGDQDLALPGFDRAADAVVPGAVAVPAAARVVLIEGNYLLLTRPLWRDLAPLFDLTIRIATPEATLRARLAARWSALPAAEAAARIEGNDLPNAQAIRAESRAADLVIRD
ncbi:MAG: phosphoribulokinase [Sphingomonadales bacterium]|nr:phosphoribulokinase [Sphingomonadales bacterium]